MLKYYFDLMSQPARALYITLKASKIPFEAKPVNLAKGEHMTDEFEKLNRFKKIPFIDHDGFVLTESVSIIKYLGDMKMLPEKLYPSDPKLQARVNEYLAWQHIGIRAPCALYFLYVKIEPLLTGQPAPERKVAKQKERMEAALDLFEEKWLGRHKFLVSDHLTVADIFATCEIEQPRMAGYDPREGRPNIEAWMKKVREELNPFYDEAHKIVTKIVDKQKSTSSKL